MSLEFQVWPVGITQRNGVFLDEAVHAFNMAQAQFHLQLQEAPGVAEICGNPIHWEAAKRRFAQSPHANKPIIIVTDYPLTDNFFSQCDGRLSIISTHAWFELYAPPCLQAFLLMEFVIAAWCLTVRMDQMELRPHSKSRGCVGDLCEWKPDVLLKLYAGYACGEHKTLLQQFGATPAQLSAAERVLELVRAYALGDDAEKRRLGAFSRDKVFVVHGRDLAAKSQLETLLTRCGLSPVAIMSEPVMGRTIIEQIHEHADVGYAVVLVTPDDEGRLRGTSDLAPRGRQNVIFEYGLFVGKLGRARVCCLVKAGALEMPSDLAGVLELRYTDEVNEVAIRLVDELHGAGYPATLR